MCEDMKANIDKLSSTPDRETHLLFLVVCSTLVLGQNKSICANSRNLNLLYLTEKLEIFGGFNCNFLIDF